MQNPERLDGVRARTPSHQRERARRHRGRDPGTRPVEGRRSLDRYIHLSAVADRRNLVSAHSRELPPLAAPRAGLHAAIA